jgi:hypothetical protein
MARWKANADGTGYYDQNDSGPDQYKPTAEESARAVRPQNPYLDPNTQARPQPGQGQGETTTPGQTNPTGGVTGNGNPYTPPTAVPQGGWKYMEGVDSNKMNDFSHTTPKYQAARILASGGSLQDAANAIGATVLDQDKIRLSDGTIVDTRRDVEGANQLQWTVTYDPNDPNWGKPAAPPPGQGTGTGAGGTGGVGLSSGNGAANGLWDILMKRAMQGTNIDPNDPNINPAVNAYRAEQERGVRNYISDQAEAAGPLANLSGERRIANEHAAQATGNMRSQLMLNELNNRRAEIQQALSQMGSLLSDQQKIELQAELGRLNAAMQQQQITNQNNQFLDQFSLNSTDRANYWDAIRSGLLKG